VASVQSMKICIWLSGESREMHLFWGAIDKLFCISQYFTHLKT